MKIVVNGSCGRLGSEVCGLVRGGYQDFELAAGIDTHAVCGGETLLSLNDFTGQADVLIDFSHHSATAQLCDFALERRMPMVIATTGQTRAEKELLVQTAQSLPIFWAANLSVGVALLVELVQTAAAMLPDTDIEIVEMHHTRKRDAPSGTALTLAQAIHQVRPESFPVFGRHGQELRRPGEVGIHALRMGNLTGTHSVMLGSDTQTLTLTHEAHTPRIYALGALDAARFIVQQSAGVYGMPQLIAAKRALPHTEAAEENENR